MHEIGIEEGLVKNAFFKDRVSDGKSQEYLPTSAFAPHYLADQHGATPVRTDKDWQSGQICYAQIAQEVLSHKRREQYKSQRRRRTFYRAGRP
jgi:hypothetical protein